MRQNLFKSIISIAKISPGHTQVGFTRAQARVDTGVATPLVYSKTNLFVVSSTRKILKTITQAVFISNLHCISNFRQLIFRSMIVSRIDVVQEVDVF